MKKLLLSLSLLTFLVGWHNPQTPKREVSFSQKEMLTLINKARSQGHRCGKNDQPAAPPLQWNDDLAKAAKKHANDMARRDFFDHVNPDGWDTARRVERESYRWQTVGENIAMGPGSTSEAMRGWLNSAGHCTNIMLSDFTEMGAAISNDGRYWVQVFAAPAGKR